MPDSQKRCLVVDNDPMVQMVAKAIIEKLGMQVTLAENGKQALEALENFMPDVILLDLMMPEMDGFEFLRTARADERLADLVIIVCSAVEERGKIGKAMVAGANDFIMKPFYPNVIEEKFRGFGVL